jgi:hypothetical protein
VRQASAEIESRRAGGPGVGATWFRLASGEEAVVRFLEQDDEIFWCHVHNVPVPDRQWGKDVVCLDQERDGTPCPGCERELPRKFKGFINLIWFDGPVVKRDSNGRKVKDSTGADVVIDRKDMTAIWSSGIRLFEDLAEINTNYRGLMSRKFKIKRKGSGLDTKYVITPADIDAGAQEFTAHETALAAEKFELVELTKPGTYDEFIGELNGRPINGQQQQNGEPQQRPNPFMRNGQ